MIAWPVLAGQSIDPPPVPALFAYDTGGTKTLISSAASESQPLLLSESLTPEHTKYCVTQGKTLRCTTLGRHDAAERQTFCKNCHREADWRLVIKDKPHII